MTSEARQLVFIVLAIIGVLVTWYFNIQFMMATEGVSIVPFVQAAYANLASTSISNDILVVVFTFLFWSYFEAKRLGMKNWWVYAVLAFAIAIAFTFPFFMYKREKAIEARRDH